MSLCYNRGITRIRISTTVDAGLLAEARELCHRPNDASLLDEALSAVIATNRRSTIDAAYAAYDEHPLDEPDEWGDLDSFRRAASQS